MDQDGDGVADDQDNCPAIANVELHAEDADDLGDAIRARSSRVVPRMAGVWVGLSP
jgi:ABC-2 type transport system ATP-binding protein